MKKIISIIIITYCLLTALCTCSLPSSSGDRKHVMVMWSTDATDPTFKEWNKQLIAEFRRQGIDAEIHPYYGEIGISREGIEEAKIIRMVHGLDSLGKRPDLILAHGDYCLWQLELNPDSLVRSIPTVAFGLKDYDWLQYQWDTLASRDYHTRNMVEIYDSLRLKENIDLADLIFNLKAEGDTSTFHLHRFVSMLDWHAVWLDSLAWRSLSSQAAMLDTNEYVNTINKSYYHGEGDSLNYQGIKQYYVYSFKTPLVNPSVRGATSTWAFYSQKSRLRYIQAKHDESTRSCTEGPNFPPYCTMTAEDFLINDSCYGGYFVTADTLLSDAVSAGKRLLAGATAESIGKRYHTPTYNVNWNVMRKRGISVNQMPWYVRLHNTTFHDYHPVAAAILYVAGVILAVVFLMFSVVYSFRSLRRYRRTSRLMKEQAREYIRDEEILSLALSTSEAIMWEGSEDFRLRNRIFADKEHSELVDTFFADLKDGMSSVQFHGSIDGQPAHWYDLRVELHHTDDGKASYSAFLVNIDHLKAIQEKAREAHQLLLEAQAREGFISAMNHEIRTPLHAVVGFSLELARPGVTFGDDEVALFAEYIESNAASLKKIINDILLVTLMSNSNISADIRPCSVESLLNPKQWRDAMALTARRKNSVDIMSGGANLMVKADTKMMAAVMENLITNASLFADEGSSIAIGWNPTVDGGVEIWVRDCGIGIKAKYYELIFERFFKINSFRPGGGLGLYIAKRYVEMMKGAISCSSTFGKGSVFTITLQK